MTKQFKLYKKSFVFALFSLFTLGIFSLFGLHPAQAETTTSDITLSINSALALSLTNCDSEGQLDTSINNQVINLDIIPTPEGLFKSTCQTLTVNANTPGYTLTAKASGTNANYDSGNPTNTLLYQNPIDLTTLNITLPTIPSTTSPTTAPTTLTNNQWGFAVEGLNPTTTPSNEVISQVPNFDSTYTINNANNTYAELPTNDTTLYKTTTFPLPKTNHNFFYATKLDTTTMAGTYATTITYTAVGEDVPEPALKYKQISIGSHHVCTITFDDNAYCWGRGTDRQLGNGTNVNSLIPTPVSRLAGGLEGLTVKKIASFSSHACAIASDDNAYCWGYDGSGRLGVGSTDTVMSSDIPVPIVKRTGGLENLTVKQISGSGTTCAIASDDNAYCWGPGSNGRLGNGSSSNSSVPVPVSRLTGGLLGLTVKQISVGGNFACAIASDDNAYCWGQGTSGELGNGGSVGSTIPVSVSRLTGGLGGLTVKQISAGSFTACVIASDDNVYCWGRGTDGQLGNETNTSSNIPVPVSRLTGGLESLTIKEISVGNYHVCAIASDDNLYCWGRGVEGQLGNETNTSSNIPVPVSRLTGGLDRLTVKQISATGTNFACAIASDDNVYCWGENTSGKLGNGTTDGSNIPVRAINPTI